MTSIHVKSALTPAGWQKNVRLKIEDGRIVSVEASTAAQPGDERHDILVPGMPNLHSHAFQRGMAGLAETRGPGADSFWSWRNVMYRFALSMTPDHAEAVASQLYMEMLEAGFSRVGEFHYLHHDIDGRPYADISEMAQRIAAAASHTGIGLTLLPVFYAHSAFGGAAPNDGQRRFISTIDSFARLLDDCRSAVRDLPDGRVGVAPHSLRAVTPHELAAVVAMTKDGPIHIHVAEQVKEVEDCIAWSGARPVEWLLDHADLDSRWCLVHATHMTDAETRRMAESKAIAGLCPITEANLGDGTFEAVRFSRGGGKFGVGSDSNVLIGLPDELRQLEYSQRLAHRSRNVLAAAGQSTARALFDGALEGGSIALAIGAGIAAGQPANFLSLRVPDGDLTDDAVLDSWLFANGTKPDSVWVAGRKLVEGGRHHRRDEISARFRSVMHQLLL
ncbi:formimidoylglutamate deiminase [Agrobacterium tumefaciens]|uniref:formimidoylglutamate deiminase n=1 Tax=Agrobacterium TaxID=357 RepID=UPI00115D2FE8|nr:MULTISPECIES: formimidoylglutamate deiminase [Agrobacterium]MDA5241549.1 formimidoylglutamate deiminase [Agrobacterium sp. MAFF310724]MDA5249319.1 formimidoylglutamate deiminase [Agrobacterium sp. MAFF210268]MDO3445662.1 formimidoylglutamate deiminase [Agrobacterium sp. V1]TRB13772.1 formimidoylglutamate deiminase [Agrobacterium tumefaciens]UNZ54336.1 formimidoylglutamate deiminase [Agrobacterium tumefaciens]